MSAAAKFAAMKRGEDYTREPGTFSVNPYPTIVGMLQTFAPLQDGVLFGPSLAPAPNNITAVGTYGILPKRKG